MEEIGMDNKVTHIVRLDPEGTSEEERERLRASFAALLASGQPLLGSGPLVDEGGPASRVPLLREPVAGDARDPDRPAHLRPRVGGPSACTGRWPSEA
jgi:hypothetical protein